ncbi:hypothetical protein [Chitinophaga sp. CF418]|uniref:hypothetical protein n=1 Tax=Chitinophaga sp. CF418 TaxID=1855287 RepID=UPI00091BE579|nr:hypothetical protein [Chitinophaga sp. CF418]SHN43814.1 hypothetical protein SAMN05216311_11663 [Chitinophaga sp. CF418]
MWWKKPKFKEIDDNLVETIKYGLPGGGHVRDMIPVEGIRGKMYLWGFVEDKFQPKPIYDILLEQMEEQKRNNRT